MIEYGVYTPVLKRKTFGAPGRYVQGAGVLKDAGAIIKALGKKALVFGGERGLKAVGALFESLEKEGMDYHKETFGKDPWGPECCDPEIDRLARIAKDKECDVIVGCGGGKPLDTAKAVANKLKVPVVIVATIASTDAPCSALSVIYDEHHVFKEYRFYNKNPDVVLIDTEVIAKAPPRFLACGIGDAMGKYTEVPAVVRSGADNLLIKPIRGFSTILAAEARKIMVDTLFKYGVMAMESVEKQVVTPALEAVVEACILHSGIVFESGGLCAAHSIYDGITLLEEKMKPYQFHGEGVFFGMLTELFLDGYPLEEIEMVMKFGHRVGLPINFEELGLADVTDADLMKVAEKACSEGETIHCSPFPVTPQMVFSAMKTADRHGREIAKEVPRRTYEMVESRIKFR